MNYEDPRPAKTMPTTLTHRYPLRRDTDKELALDVDVTLPRDLTRDEADRLAAWIQTFVVDWRTNQSTYCQKNGCMRTATIAIVVNGFQVVTCDECAKENTNG